MSRWRNRTRGRVDETPPPDTYAERRAQAFAALRLGKAKRAEYERASREAPFCPDDPTEAMVAKRDPCGPHSFFGAKVRR